MKQPIRIAISVEDGQITAIYTDASQVSFPIEILIMDFDTEGFDNVIAQPEGCDEFMVSKHEAECNPEFIEKVFNAADQALAESE